jgi:uncharacterized membrane protein
MRSPFESANYFIGILGLILILVSMMPLFAIYFLGEMKSKILFFAEFLVLGIIFFFIGFWKTIDRYLNKHEHWASWIVAISVILTAFAAISGNIHFTFTQNTTSVNPSLNCTYPINATCVCDFRDKTTYVNFKEQKCRNLSTNQLVYLAPTEISQISKYFLLSPGSQLTNFTINKNPDDTCTEHGSCLYSIVVSDVVTVHG